MTLVIRETPVNVEPEPVVVPLGNVGIAPRVVAIDDSPDVKAKRPYTRRQKKEASNG